MHRVIGLVLLAFVLSTVLYINFAGAGEEWSLAPLTDNWGVEADGWIAEQIDLGGPRFQEIDLPNPGWLLTPEERAGAMFPQVLVAGVVDLQEGIILEEAPAR